MQKMKFESPDIDKFERIVFKKRDTLDFLLSFSLKVMQAKQAGLLLGTNKTYLKFLPPAKWDRGVMHKFNGKGLSGLIFKYFGNFIVRSKGLSPVRLYKNTQFGEKEQTDGIISFVLRKHKDFYEQGVKILVIDMSDIIKDTGQKKSGKQQGEKIEEQSKVSVLSFDGNNFQPLPDLKVNNSIVRQFKSKNFVSAYIPDYGAIVFNTIREDLLCKTDEIFINEKELKQRLNLLISAIEMASLANIGRAKGKQAAHIIWRKEKRLRKTALQLKDKAIELNAQKKYLRAVGAVNEAQLNMEAVNITDGVYAFMDMVGSANIRKYFQPRDYFYILNLCHQIAANNAYLYSCRVDNFMGDCVFLQNASPFDEAKNYLSMGIHERIMLMVFIIASTFNEIRMLQKGQHAMDKEGRVKAMVKKAQIEISFRAGLEIGTAMIGPLGSDKRKIVTAIGKAVNNASRMESSGEKEKIHTTQKVMAILKDASITRDTTNIWQIIRKNKELKELTVAGSLDFFDCYKTRFKLGKDMICEKNNVAYKEFSQDITYWIQCIPD
jgi:class 3 adenylate cyclase